MLVRGTLYDQRRHRARLLLERDAAIESATTLGDEPFSFTWALVGLIVWLLLYGWVILLASGEESW